MQGFKILIVEDDPDLAESLREAFALEGHHVEIALSGEQALTRVREQPFHLTFMDFRLPGMDGVKSFHELRKLDPQAKVVMMTGYSIQHLLDEAIAAGAIDVFEKPFSIAKAIDLINVTLQTSRVLLVEDDRELGESIVEALEKCGHQGIHVTNGDEALRRFRKDDIDIVFLDLRLQHMSGAEVFSRMKEIDPSIPIFVVTGYADEESGTIAELRANSLAGLIRKPVDPRVLLQCLATAAPRHGSHHG